MNTSIPKNTATLFGHPKGLFVLFFTEMWERFSFYGMRAILVLFLVDQARGGFGWSEAATNKFYGVYILLVYLLSIPGGIIADRYIGHKTAVLWGGTLQCIGHFLLSLGSEIIFLMGLGAIIVGTGLLKPNISTMVGDLYDKEDQRRDSGFTIFYMGINIGGMLAAALVGLVGEVYGWHYGFGLAGIGMFIGLIIFVAGQQYLTPTSNLLKKGVNAFDTPPHINKRMSFTKEERDRLIVLAICLMAIFTSFVALEQAGGLLNLYAKNYTNRHIGSWEIPASMLQGLNPTFIICLGPIASVVWIRLEKRYKYISSMYKMGIGSIIVGLGTLFMVGAALQKEVAVTGKSDLYWLVSTYLFHTIGELSLSPVFLAFIANVAPPQIKSSVMGIFFAVVGMAGLIAGYLGALVDLLGELTIFQFTVSINLLIGFLLILYNKRLMRLMHHGTAPSQAPEVNT